MHKFRLSFCTIMDLNFGCEIQKLSKKEGGEWKTENDKNCIASSLFGEIKRRAMTNLLS